MDTGYLAPKEEVRDDGMARTVWIASPKPGELLTRPRAVEATLAGPALVFGACYDASYAHCEASLRRKRGCDSETLSTTVRRSHSIK